MAFDVEPIDVVETEDFIECRFQNPITNSLRSGLITSAQVFVPPVLVSFTGGPANFIIPEYPLGKYISIKHIFTPLVLLKNQSGMAGPANMTTEAHYKGFNADAPGAEILYDGNNMKPATSVRHEDLLISNGRLRVIQMGAVGIFFTIQLADVWMPDITGGGGTQTFALDTTGHEVFCGLYLLVKIHKK